MPSQPHHVERLSLNIDMPDLESALRLRARTEDLAHRHLPAMLERVFERLSPTDVRIELDRLDLDLGTIAAERLEEDAPAALERALTEALEHALAAARQAPGPIARAVPLAAAALENFDAYLVHGAPRFRGAERFDPTEALRHLIATQADALVAMLRRRARDRYVLDRLVLQLTESDLLALLALLAPADAALILAYHAELRRRYLATPTPLPAPALRHTTWVLTLEFLLHEPGSQFNRHAFVAHLLRGIAAVQGIAYSTLLVLIRDALGKTRRRRPVAASLPGVLDALIAEQESDRGSTAAGAPAPTATPEDSDEALLKRFRDAANDPAALEALVRRLTAALFARLIDRLEPAHAAVILAYVAGLTTLHRETPLVALSHLGFERQVRLIVLRYLLREAGSRFNRRSWLRRLLHRLAAVGGVSYTFLLESLIEALAALRRRLPPEGSLPVALAELAVDLPKSRSAPSPSDANDLDALIARLLRHQSDESALTTLSDGMTAETLRALVEKLRPGDAAQLLDGIAELTALQRKHHLVALSEDSFERHLRLITLRWLLRDPPPSFQRADWLTQIASALAHVAQIDPAHMSALLADARTGAPTNQRRRDPSALARAIEDDAGPAKVTLIRPLAHDLALLQRVTAALSEAGLAAALAAFGPAGDAAAADLALFMRRHAEAPLVDLDRGAFRGLISALALAALASGKRSGRADLRRRLLAGIARYQGVSVRELGDWRHIEREPEPHALTATPTLDPLAHAERFLRTGGPPASAAYLAQAAALDPAGFATLLGRLTIAASGKTGPLIERLLTWMLPEEIVAALLPDAADQAAVVAASLADMPGGSMTAAWTRILDTALRGDALEAADPTVPGARYDRIALHRHWLKHGTLPWWAPPETRIKPLIEQLAALPTLELHRLLDDADADADEIAVRLRRATDQLGPTDGTSLIERLAPWAFATAGPLATLSVDLTEETRGDARIRAAAAAIAGTPVDLDRLVRPLPAPIAERQPEQVPPPAQKDRTALFGWLAGAGPANPPRLSLWLRLLADLADRSDPALDGALRDALVRPEARARWAAKVPEEIFARVVHRLAPARSRFLLDATMILAAAWRRTAPSAAHDAAGHALRVSLLTLLAEGDLPTPRAAIGRLFASLPEAAPDITSRVRAQATELARRGGYANVAASLNQPPSAKPSRPASARKPAPEETRPPEPQPGDRIYVANAGLVLFNPYLPRFFERIGVLVPDAQGVPRVTGIEAASRAVHLLQYLVDERCDAPEHDLALNKLLSGIPLAAPVARAIEPSQADRALCAELIQAVIANWPIIKNTSPAGLRETFLQRDGRLRREPDRWTLDVERKTLDILVDQIPWSVGLIYHRWMAEPVHVNW